MTFNVIAFAAMRGVLAVVGVSIAGAGCLSRPPDVDFDAAPVQGQVGGVVAGLWDGATLRMRMVSGDVDEELDVTAEGAFQFEPVLGAGASYEVTIAQQPELHACSLAVATGTISGDVNDVEVTCEGPAVDVAFSMPVEFAFDPAQLTQRLDVSVIQQETRVTVTANDATEIRIESVLVDSGQALGPLPLAFGPNELTVAIRVAEMSRTYGLQIDRGASRIEQRLYGKASNTGGDDRFGAALAVSGDTMVVGAPGEDSSSTGVNGSEGEGSPGSGAAFVFRNVGGVWTQEAYLKASNTGSGDGFGLSVAISGDTIVVGAISEDSGSTGVGGTQGDVAANHDAGAVYVFHRSGTTWSQQAYVKASNTGQGDGFGYSVGISGDVLVVGAPFEDGVGESANGQGAAYVYRRVGTTWSFEGLLRGANSAASDAFGFAVVASGSLIAVGALQEDSSSTGVNSTPNEAAPGAGAAYLFRAAGSSWSQEAYLKASNAETNSYFGQAIAASDDVVVVGAPLENGVATTSGAAYVFERAGGAWSQTGYLKASNAGAGDGFGSYVAVWGDVAAFGAPYEDTATSGVDPAPDEGAPDSGAVYLFHGSDGAWTQRAFVKANVVGGEDQFGSGVGLTSSLVAIGAPFEDSASTGTSGDATNNAAFESGAAYLHR